MVDDSVVVSHHVYVEQREQGGGRGENGWWQCGGIPPCVCRTERAGGGGGERMVDDSVVVSHHVYVEQREKEGGGERMVDDSVVISHHVYVEQREKGGGEGRMVDDSVSTGPIPPCVCIREGGGEREKGGRMWSERENGWWQCEVHWSYPSMCMYERERGARELEREREWLMTVWSTDPIPPCVCMRERGGRERENGWWQCVVHRLYPTMCMYERERGGGGERERMVNDSVWSTDPIPPCVCMRERGGGEREREWLMTVCGPPIVSHHVYVWERERGGGKERENGWWLCGPLILSHHVYVWEREAGGGGGGGGGERERMVDDSVWSTDCIPPCVCVRERRVVGGREGGERMIYDSCPLVLSHHVYVRGGGWGGVGEWLMTVCGPVMLSHYVQHRPSQLRAKLSRAFGKKETSSKYAMESTAWRSQWRHYAISPSSADIEIQCGEKEGILICCQSSFTVHVNTLGGILWCLHSHITFWSIDVFSLSLLVCFKFGFKPLKTKTTYLEARSEQRQQATTKATIMQTACLPVVRRWQWGVWMWTQRVLLCWTWTVLSAVLNMNCVICCVEHGLGRKRQPGGLHCIISKY